MKIYRIENPGDLDGVILRDEPEPTLDAGQVLVRVRAATVNFRDHYVLKGWVPGAKPDVVPLTDAAGEIVATAPDVTRFQVGDRVVNAYFTNWIDGPYKATHQQYTVQHDGWLTHYKAVDAEALLAFPDHLTFEEASTFVCAGTTAWRALDGVGTGDTVLTLGSGSVSLFAIQFAKALGARVIATTSSPEKQARLAALGADDVINYVTDPNWGETARSMTEGRGVERVVEVGGPTTLTQSIKAIALGGQISLIGFLGGMEGGIDFMAMFMSQARFQPIPVGSRADLDAALRVAHQHDIHPVISQIHEFEDAKDAMAQAAQNNAFGKIVIRV